jgi:hypothetical protein
LTQDLCMFRSVKGIPAGGHPEVFRKGWKWVPCTKATSSPLDPSGNST